VNSSETPAPGPRRVLVFHPSPAEANTLAAQFSAQGMVATSCPDTTVAMALLYNDPPDLIVVHLDAGPKGGLALVRQFKNDTVFNHLPVLMLVPSGRLTALLAEGDFSFDDYVEDRTDSADLMARANLCMLRAYRQLDANPLSRLPGNNSIMKELERRLARKEEFATVYVDLDHFKAFNDRYGFARGDEALKLTSRLLVNCVSSGSPTDFYVGHVGGDDFIFLLPGNRAEAVCEQFIRNFDAIIGSLYDDDDRRHGAIRSVNRQGKKQTFPIMTASLAVVVNRDGQLAHPGQISALAAELKKELKKVSQSNYLFDRRRPGESAENG
jgi:diguanylate cyclase (GGDEF)-like protein